MNENKCPICSAKLPEGSQYHGHPGFYKILKEAAELHSKKNFQYATNNNPLGNFNRCGALASKILKPENKSLAICLAYMSKQVDGVFEMVGENKTGTVEEIKDKLMDILVYAAIAMLLDEEFRLKKE